jgi:hypothetical protein
MTRVVVLSTTVSWWVDGIMNIAARAMAPGINLFMRRQSTSRTGYSPAERRSHRVSLIQLGL